MTLEELKNAVIDITKRPDLEAKTLQAVQMTTLKLHSRDFWRRDLVEVAAEFDSSSYLQSFNVYEFLAQFRSLKYVRKYNQKFFEIIDPIEIFNGFGKEKVDVGYLAGEVLHLKSSSPFSVIQIGYFKHPVVTEENYSSWIAKEFPYAIIHQASAELLLGIGYQELAGAQLKLAEDSYKLMQRTGIIAEGI